VTTSSDPSGEPEVRAVTEVGLVGCGRMGLAIAGHLLNRGVPLTATDPAADALERAVASGAGPAPDAAAVAAGSDLVLVVVVNDEQVVSAVAGPRGALRGARPGSVVAVCSSVRPDTCRELALRAAESGVHLIDVALVGGERGAEEGRLALMCGGPADVIDACRPTFSAFAGDVCHLGEVGSGQVAKAVNNILLWANIRADFEALRLGRALGVDPSKLRAAVAIGSGANRPLTEWGNHRLRWPQKDLAVARDLARDAGVEVPLVDSLPALIEELDVDALRDLL
jgi:3-hydroxyisobutyrate dehydrogenase-like beta-hydroxyacid dehydrogenase